MALENPIIYQLFEPNYTIYHRASLGGLAATITAWGEEQPLGITAKVKPDSIEIHWCLVLTEQEVLRRLLEASFRLTGDKNKQMIDLPGQFIDQNSPGLRLAVHEGLCLTFLQHNKMRPGPKGSVSFDLKSVDDDQGNILTYKAVNSYAHQKAQGTGLLDEVKLSKKESRLPGQLPEIATIPQSIVPGAMAGSKALEASPQEAFLLLYLMVGCQVFLLRPRTYKEKAQACLVIPDVIDLKRFASDAKRLTSQTQNKQTYFTNSYLGRVVGGAEEAALKFLIEFQAGWVSRKKSIAGVRAIAMGKVPWDKNQINRSLSIKVTGDYREIDVFKQANLRLGGSKLLKTKKDQSFAVPISPVPELIAANLAAQRHWCAHFLDLVSKKYDFQRMLFNRRGLNEMAKAVKDEIDRVIIHAFYDAWKRIRGQLWERADNEKLGTEGYYRLLEVRSERIRNEILRLKTPDLLANWFLRFCADATRGKNLGVISDNPEQIRKFIFSSRNFNRFQN
ncbi:MAG: type I-MYXAN CRISPR-associated Cas8a1/Cmx1, partial [Cyanobacteria bacterium J06558_2]